MLDSTGVGFSVEVTKSTSGNAAMQLVMDIDTNSIKLEPVQDNWAGGLDVMLAQFDGKANLLKSSGRQVTLNLTAADREQLLRHGFVLNAPIQVKENCDHIRIILRDVKTGAIGSVTIPLSSVR
jgi:hypothetical protein